LTAVALSTTVCDMTTTATPVALPTLRRSADRKVSPVIRRQKSKDAPRSLNTFGLPAGDSCPGKTPFCEGCYAASLERIYTSTARLLRANYDALLALGDDVDGMAAMLGAMVDDWAAENAKVAGAPVFRIHWDGDFYSLPYAQAWRRVVLAHPEVQFWAYTRTFDAVPVLAGIGNLALYLSVDAYNVDDAASWLALYPSVLAAWCAETQADAAVLAEKCSRKPAPCPENVGKLPLVVAASGRRCEAVNVGDDAQGACVACGLCVYGRRDVAFATRKR
jgi:hypothetical protein